MKITVGPMIEKFAAAFDIPVQEVVDWLDEYINSPPEPGREPTEKERFASIKAYVESRLKETTTYRIKGAA